MKWNRVKQRIEALVKNVRERIEALKWNLGLNLNLVNVRERIKNRS